MKTQEVINEFLKSCYAGTRVPANFWTKENMIIVLKYLYQSKEITDKDILEKGLTRRLNELRLHTLRGLCNGITGEMVYLMSDGKITADQLPRAVRYIATDDLRRFAAEVCLTNEWKTDEDIAKNFKCSLLPDKLTKSHNVVDLLKAIFPNINIYEFALPSDVWYDEEHVKGYIKYMVKKHTKSMKRSDVLEAIKTIKFNRTLVKRYGLFKLVDMVFPGKVHKWEIENPKLTTIEEMKEYMEWYLYEYKKYTDEQLLKIFNRDIVPSFVLYRFSITDVFDALFKGKYYRWDFKRLRRIIDQNNAEDYVRWVMERNNVTITDIYNDRYLIVSGSREFPKHQRIFIYAAVDKLMYEHKQKMKKEQKLA